MLALRNHLRSQKPLSIEQNAQKNKPSWMCHGTIYFLKLSITLNLIIVQYMLNFIALLEYQAAATEAERSGVSVWRCGRPLPGGQMRRVWQRGRGYMSMTATGQPGTRERRHPYMLMAKKKKKIENSTQRRRRKEAEHASSVKESARKCNRTRSEPTDSSF